MKKILILSLAIVSATIAFGIEESQKEAFDAKVKEFIANTEKDFHKKLADTYEEMKEVTDPIADWALESPAEYYAWTKSSSQHSNYQWVVRYNIRQRTPIVELSDVQDLAINDGEGLNQKAKSDKNLYNRLKASNWQIEGIPFSPEKAFVLSTVFYNDLEYIESLDDAVIANHFGDYIKAVEKACAKMSAKEAWRKYVSIVARFTPFKDVKAVKNNWERLESNQDAMATIARQEMLLNESQSQKLTTQAGGEDNE